MKNNIEFLISLAICKGRNIVYYRERDTRTRCQYIHVIRKYRESLVDLLREMSDSHPRYTMFVELVKVISPKVTSEECNQTILNIKNILTSHGIEIK